MTRQNDILSQHGDYPVLTQVGTGTFGTAVTFDTPYTTAPVVVITPTSSPATTVTYTATATGFTALASTSATFAYIAVGLRE